MLALDGHYVVGWQWSVGAVLHLEYNRRLDDLESVPLARRNVHSVVALRWIQCEPFGFIALGVVEHDIDQSPEQDVGFGSVTVTVHR